MSAKSIYRIRGFDQPQKLQVVQVREKKTSHAINLEDLVKYPALGNALKAIDRPILTDFLPHAPLERLSACWPTFPFFSRPWNHRPIKIHPTALGPHLSGGRELHALPELKAIEKSYREQKRETDHIKLILALAEGASTNPPPLLTDIPIASSLLSSFLPRTTKESNEHLLEIVQKSPVAAYLILHLGCRPTSREDFIRQILPNPHLIFDLCANTKLGDHVPDEWLPNVFKNHPHLLPLVRFAEHKFKEKEAWEALKEVAETDFLGAAFAIGLQPENPQAKTWNVLVLQKPEAIYWAMRVWLSHHDKVSEFPYWLEFQTHVKRDVRWLYHWVRDVDSSEAKDAVKWHWPNPWAVEMIQDLKLDTGFVRGLYETSLAKSDDEDPWANAVLFWAAEFVNAREKKENETSEDE